MGERQGKWERIDAHSLRNVGGDGGVCRRVYGRNGRLWPRLVVAVYEREWPEPSLVLSASRKMGPGEWWEDQSLPVSLARDASEMLIEAGDIVRGREGPS